MQLREGLPFGVTLVPRRDIPVMMNVNLFSYLLAIAVLLKVSSVPLHGYTRAHIRTHNLLKLFVSQVLSGIMCVFCSIVDNESNDEIYGVVYTYLLNMMPLRVSHIVRTSTNVDLLHTHAGVDGIFS